MNKEITKNMIKAGRRNGIVTIIDSPQSDGAVCQIKDPKGTGEYWFYFGGLTAAESTAKEYEDNVPEEDIVNEIYDALCGIRDDSEGESAEYGWYKAVLEENAPVKSISGFLAYMQGEFPEPMSTPFTRDLIDNLVKYAYSRYGHSKQAAIYMLADIVPEVDYEELEMYLPDFSKEEVA